MFKISRLADYGLLVLNYLGESSEEFCSSAAIAKQIHLNLPTVSKVLKLLNEAQLVVSIRGVKGGYRLAKDLQQIRLAEVIAAIDGAPALTECCQIKNSCVHDEHCRLRDNWKFINRLILQLLNQYTLADMKEPLALRKVHVG